MIRKGRLVAQTRDHSRVQLMLDQGVLDAEAAAVHPGRNRIFSCLGGNHPPQIEFSRGASLANGDVIAICSNGVWGPLEPETLVKSLADGRVMESVPKVMNEAELLGGHQCDNMTLIAMTWHDDHQEDIPDTAAGSAGGGDRRRDGAGGGDAGEASVGAVRVAVRLAAGLGRKIMFVRVVNPLIERSSLYPARETVEKEQTDQQREAEAQARGWLMDLEVEGPLDVRRGGTLEEILGAVRRHHAAFVVCGTRRLGLLGGIFSGSLSSELAAYSSVPVLVVPPDAT